LQVKFEFAAEGTWLRALLQLEGVKLLANILQASWPDNADFGASTCPSGTKRLLIQLWLGSGTTVAPQQMQF
jgi:hypothetical protein